MAYDVEEIEASMLLCTMHTPDYMRLVVDAVDTMDLLALSMTDKTFQHLVCARVAEELRGAVTAARGTFNTSIHTSIPALYASAVVSKTRFLWAVSCGLSTYRIAEYAASWGHLNVLEWVQEQGCLLDGGAEEQRLPGRKKSELARRRCAFEVLLTNATRGGHLDIMQWLSNVWNKETKESLLSSAPCENMVERACVAAAENGHLHVLKYIYETEDTTWFFTDKVFTAAAKSGNLSLLTWLRKNESDGQLVGYEACDSAAAAGNLDALRWLHDCNYLWHSDTYMHAATSGGVAILTYLLDENCPRDVATEAAACECAAERGHLEALQWLRQNNFGWNANTMLSAASNGHIAVLRWAHQNGCPFDVNGWEGKMMCEQAAFSGHVEVLRFVCEQMPALDGDACPWTPKATRSAFAHVSHRHTQVIELAIETFGRDRVL
tara:strand:- start:430 stop:1737 length:1308 start_codon:yes stop_codon:yes gene_type:complete